MARGRQTDALAAVGWRMDKQTVPRMSRANTDDLQAHWQAGNSVGCLKGCDVRMSTGKPEPPAEDGRRTDADLDRSLIAAGMRKAKTDPLRPHGLAATQRLLLRCIRHTSARAGRYVFIVDSTSDRRHHIATALDVFHSVPCAERISRARTALLNAHRIAASALSYTHRRMRLSARAAVRISSRTSYRLRPERWLKCSITS